MFSESKVETGLGGNPEQREPTSYTIKLHIMRHGEKDGLDDVTQKEDVAIRLTPKGKLQARERGIELDTQGGVASGSTRERTHETALHMAHASNPHITGEESLEELVEKTGQNAWTNYNLDMPFEKGSEEFEKVIAAYKQGRLLQYYTEVDDTVVREGGDRGKTVYGIQARNIASILERFARIAQKQAHIKGRAEAAGEEFESDREHSMGTHGSVMESFVIEVVRRTLGEEEKQRMLDTIPNGVSVSQGMSINIKALSNNEEPTIHIHFSGGKEGAKYTYDHEVPISVIQDIVKDFSPQ